MLVDRLPGWGKALLLALVLIKVGATEEIICSACQGLAGSDCDKRPWNITDEEVSCVGKCVTRRSLYSNGRNLRTIWRGCEATLFPIILPDAYKDTCSQGNFFVECVQSCEEPMCNLNSTGVPACWTCAGDHQSCDLPPPTQCEEIVTTTIPPQQTECISCTGEKGDICDVRPYRSLDTVICAGSCITWKTLHPTDRSLLKVQRGCAETLLPSTLRPAALDGCLDLQNATECSATCTGYKCNKYLSGFTDCWTEEGRQKPECAASVTAQEELPAGANITCTRCNGLEGSLCDTNATQELHTETCTGACVVRRTLYATGRRLVTIWRGCETTIFPLVLPTSFRNTCNTGNFFVECTDTCRTGDKCNQNMTGVPSCWSCLGDPQPCNIEQPSSCADLTPTSTAKPVREIQCISCHDTKGSLCDRLSYRIQDRVACNSSCVTKRLLDGNSRETLFVSRGCEDDIATGLDKLDSCIETADNNTSCMTGCDTFICNKYSNGIAECWTEEGYLKPACSVTTTTERSSLLNPSRITTTKAYSIQDASGGDNYRGEWRPTGIPGAENDTEFDSWNSTERKNSKRGWSFSFNRRNGGEQLSTSACLVFAMSLKAILQLTE